MKHGRLLFCTAALMAMVYGTSVNAATPLDITLNGSYIKTAWHGFIEEGSAMVPVRSISEVFGCDDVNWNENERKVSVNYNNKILEIFVDTQNAEINGNAVKMPRKSRIINGKTYVSLRFISEFFDSEVKWNALTHTAEIIKDGYAVSEIHIDDTYTSSDLEWLAKIVHAEAGGEPDDGKVAVANVVMNRKHSSEFPNTVYDVVFDRKYGVQFTPVANGAIHNNPSKESYHAAKKALFGKNIAGDSLYFCNLNISTNMWIPNNRTFYKQIGKHSFYL